MRDSIPFVSSDLDCTSWPSLETLYRGLLDRPLTAESDVRQWLRDFSDLAEVVDEFGALKFIDNTCHTDNPAIEAAYLSFVRNIEPHIKPLYFELQKKFLSAVQAVHLQNDALIAQQVREWQADVDAYCEKNIPLQVKDTEGATADLAP